MKKLFFPHKGRGKKKGKVRNTKAASLHNVMTDTAMPCARRQTTKGAGKERRSLLKTLYHPVDLTVLFFLQGGLKECGRRVDNCSCPDRDSGGYERPVRNGDPDSNSDLSGNAEQIRKDTFGVGANLIITGGKALSTTTTLYAYVNGVNLQPHAIFSCWALLLNR